MIRVATMEDVPAIQLIARLSLDDAYEDLLSNEVKEEFLQTYYSKEVIEERLNDYTILMADTEAGTVAFGIFNKDQDNITRIMALYVLPQHQRQGVGQALLDAITLFVKENSDGVAIEIESRNMRAQKFYSKQGFESEKAYPLDLFGQPLKMTYLVRRF